MIDKIPPNQTVEVGSVWDMRNEPDDLNGGSIGLFKVAKIEDNIACASGEEEGLCIGVNELANGYLKLTPDQVKKIEAEMKEYHRQSIQPMKGPNGKIVQVGSVWDYCYPDNEKDRHTFIVGSLGHGDVVWSGPEYQGWGVNASTLLQNGEEIPIDQLPEYYSEKRKKLLQEKIKEDSEENPIDNIAVDRVFDNGKLVNYSVNSAGIKSPHEDQKVIYHDREATKEEKEEIEAGRREFIEWVMRERALAAESPNKIMQKMITKHAQVRTPLLKKISSQIYTPIFLQKQSKMPVPEPALKKKHQVQLEQSQEKERLRA